MHKISQAVLYQKARILSKNTKVISKGDNVVNMKVPEMDSKKIGSSSKTE
jgi:hypothetical protein